MTRPWVLAGLVLATVFIIEVGIMLWVAAPDAFSSSAVYMALIDATVLSVVLVPVLWLMLVRPIARLADQRGDLLTRLIEAQDQERARLAHEMHDQIGQELTAVQLGLRAVRQACRGEAAEQLAEQTSQVASQCMATLRRISHGLAPAGLADFGIAPAIEQLIATLQVGDELRIAVAIDPDLPRMSRQTETAAFRLVQESLTNVLRHAQASESHVAITMEAGWLRLSVRDNGVGVGTRHRGDKALETMGIRGMRERAESLGGTLQVEPAAGGGTLVIARLPRTERDEQR